MLINERFDNGKAFDWGLTSEDYAKYRDIYPDELYKRLKELGVAADGTAECALAEALLHQWIKRLLQNGTKSTEKFYQPIPNNSQLSTRYT